MVVSFSFVREVLFMIFTTESGGSRAVGWLDGGVCPVPQKYNVVWDDKETWPIGLAEKIDIPTIVVISCDTYLAPADVEDEVIRLAANRNAVVLCHQQELYGQ